MASAPIKLYGPTGDVITGGGSNRLFEASRHKTGDRPRAPRVDRDFSQNLSNWGWRELLAASRFLFSNVAPLKQALRTQASLAIRNAYIPQYYGRNKKFGDLAESLLFEWHKIMDVRGGMYDWATNLKLWSMSIRRDGDVGVNLVSTAADYPLTQTIPAHRIGGWNAQNGVVESGPYAGRMIYNGVIRDSYGRDLAYRVYDPDGKDYQDISAITLLDEKGIPTQTADMHLFYAPDWADQGRGLPRGVAGFFDWTDRRQVNDFLKIALKKEASFAVVEYNETGSFDTGNDFAIEKRGDSAAAAAYYENTEGGLTQIYKAGTGSKIEFPSGNRPAAVTQEFWLKITRDAFAAIDWPMEFFDSMSKGGAALRLVMELALPGLEDIQRLANRMAVTIDRWRIAKAIQAGELPPDVDWWKIEHQTPQQITADKGYSAQIDREDLKLGITTMKDVTGRRGQWYQDIIQQRGIETRDFLREAQAIATEFNITLEAALNLLRQPSANPPQQMTEKKEDPADE